MKFFLSSIVILLISASLMRCKQKPQLSSAEGTVVFDISIKAWADSLAKESHKMSEKEGIDWINSLLDTSKYKNRFELAVLFQELAFCYESTGDLLKAKENYEHFLMLMDNFDKSEYANKKIASCKNLSSIYAKLGDFKKSIVFAKKGVLYYEKQKIDSNNILLVNYLQIELSSALIHKEEYDEALNICEKGVSLIDSIAISREKKYEYKSGLFLNIFRILTFRNENQTKVLAFAKEVKDSMWLYCPSNLTFQAEIDYAISSFLLTQKDYESAKKNVLQSITYFKKDEKYNKRELSKAFILLGEIEICRNDFHAALFDAQQSLTNLLPKLPEKNYEKNPEITDFHSENAILEAIALKGKAALKLYENTFEKKWLLLSKQCNSLANDMSDELLKNIQYSDSKLYERRFNREIFNHQFKTLFELHQKFKDKNAIMEAFALAERSRAQLMREELQRRLALQAIDSTQKSIIIALQFEISELQKEVLEVQGEDLRVLQKEISEKTQKLYNLEQDIETRFPEYAKYKFSNTQLSYSQAKKAMILDNQTVVVSYFYDETREMLYIITLLKDGEGQFLAKPLKRQDIDDFYQMVSNEKANSNLSSLAYQLYNTLLSDVFKQHPQTKSLIIIPEGALSKLPFDALNCTASINSNANEFLCQKVFLHYLPSATLVTRLQKPSFFEKNNTYIGIAPDYKNSSFSDVKESQTCINKIKDIWNGIGLINEAATVSSFKKLVPQFSIVHFYGHAKANEEEGGRSFLVLTPKITSWWKSLFVKKGDTEQLNVLNIPKNEEIILAHEVEVMDIKANLVVLSACETGLGKNAVGEGIMSLSRVFFNAGAKSTLMSFWSINSATTAQITTSFFQYLHQGKRKDEALTLAKRDFIAQHPKQSQPYYWAGLALSGDSAPINITF